jgi:putative cytotoxic protein
LPVPVPDSGFIKDLEYLGAPAGRRRYRNRSHDRIYEWDSLHGELEVYSKRGRHLGVVDAEKGEMIKAAVRGRRIDV